MSIIKEDFCGACLAIPLAFAGVGVTSYGNSQKKYKYGKKIVLGGLVFTFISLIVAIYFYFKFNNCR